MIGCMTNNGMCYISKLEYFREIMNDEVYDAVVEYWNRISYDNNEYISELKHNEELDTAENERYDAVKSLENTIDTINEIIEDDSLDKEEIITRLKGI
jgi:hypothetical protein